jgi:hypothetical protein
MTTDLLLGFVVGVIFIYLLIEVKNQCFIKSTSTQLMNDIIKTLVRQCARWSTAAQQDQNSLISVLHANYGAGYLWALKDIATDQQIVNATHIDIKQFTDEVTKIQDHATKKMATICPKYAPQKTYLTTIGGEL